MKKFTKDMLIGDILNQCPGCSEYFIEMGMFCIGCPASWGESLQDACMVHGVDVDEMVEKLNEKMNEKSDEKADGKLNEKVHEPSK